MAQWEKEKRTGRLMTKIQPSLKEAAEQAAAEDGRSLSNYVEWLIKQDLKNRSKKK